jgi:small GTP-binding protein
MARAPASSSSSAPPPPPQQADRLYKICVAGDSGVGKTSLLKRFCKPSEEFGSTQSTIGVDFRVFRCSLGGYAVDVQLWDTAGQERFQALTGNYFRAANGIICAFDVTRPETLESIERWAAIYYQQLEREGKSPNDPACTPCVLVLANKIDLMSETSSGEEQLKQRDMMARVTRMTSLKGWFLYLVSAKTSENVILAFNAFIQHVHNEYNRRYAPVMTAVVTNLRSALRLSGSGISYSMTGTGGTTTVVFPNTGTVVSPRASSPGRIRANSSSSSSSIAAAAATSTLDTRSNTTPVAPLSVHERALNQVGLMYGVTLSDNNNRIGQQPPQPHITPAESSNLVVLAPATHSSDVDNKKCCLIQ